MRRRIPTRRVMETRRIEGTQPRRKTARRTERKRVAESSFLLF